MGLGSSVLRARRNGGESCQSALVTPYLPSSTKSEQIILGPRDHTAGLREELRVVLVAWQRPQNLEPSSSLAHLLHARAQSPQICVAGLLGSRVNDLLSRLTLHKSWTSL